MTAAWHAHPPPYDHQQSLTIIWDVVAKRDVGLGREGDELVDHGGLGGSLALLLFLLLQGSLIL